MLALGHRVELTLIDDFMFELAQLLCMHWCMFKLGNNIVIELVCVQNDFFFFFFSAGQRFPLHRHTLGEFRVGGGVHDSYTFQCGLVGSFTSSPGIDVGRNLWIWISLRNLWIPSLRRNPWIAQKYVDR